MACSLDGLASSLSVAGDRAGAQPLYERALAIQENALGPDHPNVAGSLASLANLSLTQGQRKESAALALRAEKIARKHFCATARVLPERQALALAGLRSSGLSTAISLLVEPPDLETKREILDALVRSRALVLDEMASRHRSLKTSDDLEIEHSAASHRAAVARYATLLVRGPDAEHPERYRPLLEQARQEMEGAERRLRQKLWDPLVPHLSGMARVFVVPDGAVNLVNLATLPSDAGAYLLEDGPLFHYVSSERSLVTLDSLPAGGQRSVCDGRLGVRPARRGGTGFE